MHTSGWEKKPAVLSHCQHQARPVLFAVEEKGNAPKSTGQENAQNVVMQAAGEDTANNATVPAGNAPSWEETSNTTKSQEHCTDVITQGGRREMQRTLQ